MLSRCYKIAIFILMMLFLVGCSPAESTATATETPEYLEIPGVYLGTFHGTSSSSVRLFEEIGKDIAISASYLNFASAFNSGLLRSNAYVGRISFLTWEFTPGPKLDEEGYSGRVLEAIVDGLYDDYLVNWAEGMAEFGKPVFLRFGHEMNGDWYPWSGVKNGGSNLDGYDSPELADGPERFVDAFRHIHDIFIETGADNALCDWCPNAPFADMEQALGAWNSPANYYPGDAYVDWMCFDGYNWGSTVFGQQFNAQWRTFDEIFNESYVELQAINAEKPIIIGEFASTEEGGDKAAWIRDSFSAIREDYPQIRGLIWFHIAKETDWRINSSDESIAAYRESVADDYWLSDYPGMAD